MKGDEKLCLMRILMKDKGYDAYIILHGDQHNNVYIAEADEKELNLSLIFQEVMVLD